jgi:hypothetical protein
MTITYTFPVCKICGKNHGRVVREVWLRNARRCDCQLTKPSDPWSIISETFFCSTSAEARRVSKTITLKNTLAEAKTPSFYDVMVKCLSKKKADEIEKVIRQLLKNRNSAVVRSDLVNPDYCNAFGIMQGVAYTLGFNAMNSHNGQPRRWFDDIAKEYPYPFNRPRNSFMGT